MVTVMELLSHPQFANFNLITDSSGLSNPVTKTGILDWESIEDIRATFNAGEFVLTTLSGAKDDNHRIDELLKVLMEKRVAAIAIKNIHHYRLSSQTISIANQHHIPIFLFHETYMDDLIYIIRNAVDTNSLNGLVVNKLRRIMEADKGEDIKALALDLNPFFYENHICCFCIPKAEGNHRDAVESYSAYYRKYISENPTLPNIPYLMIEGNGSIVFIYSDTPEDRNLKEEFMGFLEKIGMSAHDFRIGISLPKSDLSELRKALLEAFFSALACVLDKESHLHFDQIGLDQVLLPTYDSPWTQNYYNSFHNILTEYDLEHNTNLHETLLMYIRNNGDIALTAELLFQHQNTIRYRLSRIRELLQIEHSAEPYLQLYLYVRLREIYLFLESVDLL